MTNKKLILKEISLFARIVLLVALVFSLIFYDKYVFATFFIVAGCLEICDCILNIKDANGCLWLDILSIIVGRCIFFIPLLFLTISKALTIWVLLILVFFEIVIALYRKFVKSVGRDKIVTNVMYFLYIILLWLSIFIWCFYPKIAMYLLVSCSILAGLYIIYCSVIIGNEAETDTEHIEDNSDKEDAIKNNIEKDLDADKNQIIE